MSTIIKLQRQGAPHRPFWRIVVTDSRKPGGFIDLVGTYNNLPKPVVVKLNEAKAAEWLSKGATPSPTVKKIFMNHGIYQKAVGTAKDGNAS